MNRFPLNLLKIETFLPYVWQREVWGLGEMPYPYDLLLLPRRSDFRYTRISNPPVIFYHGKLISQPSGTFTMSFPEGHDENVSALRPYREMSRT